MKIVSSYDSTAVEDIVLNSRPSHNLFGNKERWEAMAASKNLSTPRMLLHSPASNGRQKLSSKLSEAAANIRSFKGQ